MQRVYIVAANHNEQILELLKEYPHDASVYRDTKVKSDGGKRVLSKPNAPLAIWLKRMNGMLTEAHDGWPTFIHGGRKGRSYVSYARPHVGHAMLITIDIRECFPSVTGAMTAYALQKHIGFSHEDAIELAEKLCDQGKLAQGFSTSNFICNLVLLDVLQILHESLSKVGITFTNYVDDLALSGDIEKPSEVINEVATELSRAGLKVKKAKIIVMPSNNRQIICGLIVNKKLTVSKERKVSLLRGVATGALREEQVRGWIANTKNFDRKFSEQLARALEIKHGKVKPQQVQV